MSGHEREYQVRYGNQMIAAQGMVEQLEAARGEALRAVPGNLCPCGKSAAHVTAPEDSPDSACRIPGAGSG